jgi:hypothetical protein
MVIADCALSGAVNRRHRATLVRIFARQVPADLAWRDIEALFRALGATIRAGGGSRMQVELNGIVTVFHRPDPGPETKKGAARAVRALLKSAGVKP